MSKIVLVFADNDGEDLRENIEVDFVLPLRTKINDIDVECRGSMDFEVSKYWYDIDSKTLQCVAYPRD